jgi:hypothetical protein
MPNGKPGDHPLTDIVIHGRRVYSDVADHLVRAIVKLASREERDRLADLLFQEYNDFGNPNDAELELRLTAMLAELEASARTRGWKPS